MASYTQINRKIRRLQEQIDDANKKCNSTRIRLSEEMAANAARLRNEFAQEIQRQQQITQREYSQKLQNLQEEILAAQRKKLKEIEEETDKYIREQKKLISQVEEIQAETINELEKLKKQTNEEKDFEERSAREAYEEMLNSKAIADQGPHTFFHPNQFEIITQQTEKIQNEIESQMYQSALADANATSMQYNVLSVKTENNLNEWCRSFYQFSMILSSLNEEIDSFLEAENGDGDFSEEECDFWSKGRFSQLKREIDAATQMVKEITRKGIIEYLKAVEHPDKNEIYSAVNKAKHWQTRLLAILGCIRCERSLSHERFDVGEIVATYLSEDGYSISVHKFKTPTENDAKQKWYVMPKNENPFETFEIVAGFEKLNDMIHINFVPVRKNGIVEENMCVIYIELSTIQSDKFEEQYLNGLKNKIEQYFQANQISMSIEIQAFLSDVAAHKMANDVKTIVETKEKMKKGTPEPDEQIRLMEKKYYI